MAKKIFLLVLSIASYIMALLMYVINLMLILYNYDFDLFEPNILCIIFTMTAFFFFEKIFFPKRIRFSYIILFFITYIALVIGNNNVFDFTLIKLLKYCEYLNIIESEQLWDIWSNDLSRNLMYFYAIFYSIVTSIFYYVLKKIFSLFEKK